MFGVCWNISDFVAPIPPPPKAKIRAKRATDGVLYWYCEGHMLSRSRTPSDAFRYWRDQFGYIGR